MIDEAARALGATFPAFYRKLLLAQNGGDWDLAGEFWEAFPVPDKSDNKTIARTYNSVVRETSVARQGRSNFPSTAVAIAGNAGGDLLVLVPHEGDPTRPWVLAFWDHETGNVEPVEDPNELTVEA